jgi:hypothetical protein
MTAGATTNDVRLEPAARTHRLSLELVETHGPGPPGVLDVRCYGPETSP